MEGREMIHSIVVTKGSTDEIRLRNVITHEGLGYFVVQDLEGYSHSKVKYSFVTGDKNVVERIIEELDLLVVETQYDFRILIENQED